jgi:hypothetical protein
MWDDCPMIDLPIAEVLDDSICMLWLERHLHPDGMPCPHCRSTERRLFRAQGHVPADRCRACEGYDTLVTGTVFENTRPRPATLVRRRRGMAKGEPTARLARALGRSRTQLHTLRRRLQAPLNETAPTAVRMGTAFAADALSHNAGETKHAPACSRGSTPATCQQAKRAWHLR